jgi:hypothetical protein
MSQLNVTYIIEKSKIDSNQKPFKSNDLKGFIFMVGSAGQISNSYVYDLMEIDG